MRVLFKFTPDICNKGTKVAMFFLEKNLEFFTRYRYIGTLILNVSLFVLYPASVNAVFKKKAVKGM